VLALEGHTGDERKAVKACLRQIDLRGCIVTGDALHTNADFAQTELLKRGRNSSSN
jgi:predicted transposase YbfD/YdcC